MYNQSINIDIVTNNFILFSILSVIFRDAEEVKFKAKFYKSLFLL